MGVDIEQMIKVTGTSEYNFEFYIVVEDKKDLEKAKGICAKAYDDWWSETTDETIAHLAVGLSCPMIKTGAIGGERIAKLNELIRIEEELLNPQMGKF